MKTVDHKCPNCNAALKYDPKTKGWKCEYCGSSFTLEDLKNNENNFTETKVKKEEEMTEMDEYYCQDCGAKIVADPNTAATFCVYCKNTAILKSRLADKFSPSKIIPFTKTKEDAIEAFKKVGKGKFLMPKEFSDPKNIQELTGVYIPFWLFSGNIDGKVQGTGNRVMTWSDKDYIYTKTDVYSLERNGVCTFSNVPCDGSMRFDDAIMNSIEPFDYKELTDFSYSYLSGFLAEKYDVEQDKAKEEILKRTKASCESKLHPVGYSGYKQTSSVMNVMDDNTLYALLPVWMVNIKYQDKMHTFAMNGQTGKMIGDIPYSKSKALVFGIIVFLISFALLALITYFI